jgi:site-specific recombinase XerD
LRHPEHAWVEAGYAEEPLDQLVEGYLSYLAGRAEAVSPQTILKYRKSLTSLVRSIAGAGEATVLGSLTPAAVNRWVAVQRLEGKADEGVASRLSAVKVFARKYVFKYLGLTRVDLLEKVPRLALDEAPVKAGLSQEERDQVIATLEPGHSYEDVRNTAFVKVLLSTGVRYNAARTMKLADLNELTGEFRVVEKGGVERPAQMSPAALRSVRVYLRVRPAGASGYLWLTEDGELLSYWGGQSFIKRLKQRSGVKRFHAHLCRHTFGQVALQKGAERALVQDMLGHKSDVMTRRYTGDVRKTTAAKAMPRFAAV